MPLLIRKGVTTVSYLKAHKSQNITMTTSEVNTFLICRTSINSISVAHPCVCLAGGQEPDKDAKNAKPDADPDWEHFTPEEKRELRELMLGARAQKRIADYKWDQAIGEVAKFPNLQEPKPLEPQERKSLMRDVPDLYGTFPCQGLRSMGDDRARVNPADRWFLERGAPRLHLNMLEEINLLTYILQEMQDGEGTRLDLSEEQVLDLMKKAINLQIDSLQLLASMQIQRACSATARSPPSSEDEKQKLILSDKLRAEDAKKKQEQQKEERSRSGLFSRQRRGGFSGNGAGGRRPRFAPIQSQQPAKNGSATFNRGTFRRFNNQKPAFRRPGRFSNNNFRSRPRSS